MSIVLIGYRGSGKTTVGRLLSRKLALPFVDIDKWIVGRAGKNIAEIFASDGEQAFRDFESATLAQAMALENHVIALGGGALGRPQNLAIITQGGHKIVYLRCQPEELLRRIQADQTTAESRPALTPLGGGIEEIRQILADREPIWLAAKTHELDVTRLSPDEVVVQLLKIL